MSGRQVNEMERKEEAQIIYLKDLIFAALYWWRAVLAVALIAALLLGGFAFVKAGKTGGAVSSQAMEEYEASVAAQKQQIDQLERGIAGYETYIQESVLMKLDPYGHYEAVMGIYVQTDYQILPGMEYQNPDKTGSVLQAYQSLFYGAETKQAVAEIMKTQPLYAEELMLVKKDDQTHTLEMRILCPTQEQANAAVSLLEKVIAEGKAQIEKDVSDHETVALQKYAGQRVDSSMVDSRKKELARMDDMKTNLTKAKTALAGIKAPSANVVTTGQKVKKAAVMAVIGAVVGVFLTVCAAFVAHIAGGKVYSGRTLRNRTGAKVIGALEAKPRKCPVDRLLRKWEGRSMTIDPTALATDIRCRAEEAKHLLITGCGDQAERETLVSAVAKAMPQAKVEDAGTLAEAAGLEALRSCDAVVLVAKCGVSSYESVSCQLEQIKDYNKQLIGCVVLDG